MNGPKLWADMLAAINIPGAVVAGGCIRDCYLCVEPKDIDIFIPCGSMEGWLEFKYNLLGRMTGVTDLLDTQEGKEYENTDFSKDKNPLYGVLEGEFMGYTINIIARTNHDDPYDLVSMFDFGFLQMFYDGESVKHTIASETDRYLRRATMMHDRHIEQSLARFYRFNARNPGLLSLNVPFEYHHVPTVS